MPTLVTQTGTLTDATFWETWPRAGAVSVANRWQDYATIYRTQPHVRTAVDLIARQCAHLGLHVYRRIDDNDRERITDHPLARLLERPNPWTTRDRFVSSIMSDRGIYGQSFVLKVKGSVWGNMALLRVPVPIVEVKGGLVPTSYKVHLSDRTMDVDPAQIIHFRNYNPDSSIVGLSPIESLRNLLDEDLMAVEHRRDTWNNAGRQPVILKRPKSAGAWSPEVAKRFTELFTAAFRDPKSATTPLLEDDMDLEVLSFNAEQSQYAEVRRLTREEVYTAYHIPLAVVSASAQASTYAAVAAYRKMLYAETLGPLLDETETDLELQLLQTDFQELENAYVEFNVMEKLKGDFEETADMMQKAIGRPWMTPNEGRARQNLPSMGEDADKLAVPLNIDPTGGEGIAPNAGAVNAARERILARQRQALASGKPWDAERWNRELTVDLAAAGVPYPLAMAQEINDVHRAQLQAPGPNGHVAVN